LELLKNKNAVLLEERAVILALYHAIGRAGEVAALNFTNRRWTDCLWSGWNEFKTGKDSEINFFPDKEDSLTWL